jgi:hypothetical protein
MGETRAGFLGLVRSSFVATVVSLGLCSGAQAATSANYDTNCSGCHGAPPTGTKLNAGGSTSTVLDYVIAHQGSMPGLSGLAPAVRTDIAVYIGQVAATFQAYSTAFNTPVTVDVSNNLTLNTVSFTSVQKVANPTGGTLAAAFTGTTILYTPPSNTAGSFTFAYRGIGNVTGDTRTATVTVSRGSQAINFVAQAGHAYAPGGTFPLSPAPSASSGLAVNTVSSTPAICSVAGNTVTTLAAGTCTIAASQPGYSN